MLTPLGPIEKSCMKIHVGSHSFFCLALLWAVLGYAENQAPRSSDPDLQNLEACLPYVQAKGMLVQAESFKPYEPLQTKEKLIQKFQNPDEKNVLWFDWTKIQSEYTRGLTYIQDELNLETVQEGGLYQALEACSQNIPGAQCQDHFEENIKTYEPIVCSSVVFDGALKIWEKQLSQVYRTCARLNHDIEKNGLRASIKPVHLEWCFPDGFKVEAVQEATALQDQIQERLFCKNTVEGKKAPKCWDRTKKFLRDKIVEKNKNLTQAIQRTELSNVLSNEIYAFVYGKTKEILRVNAFSDGTYGALSSFQKNFYNKHIDGFSTKLREMYLAYTQTVEQRKNAALKKVIDQEPLVFSPSEPLPPKKQFVFNQNKLLMPSESTRVVEVERVTEQKEKSFDNFGLSAKQAVRSGIVRSQWFFLTQEILKREFRLSFSLEQAQTVTAPEFSTWAKKRLCTVQTFKEYLCLETAGDFRKGAVQNEAIQDLFDQVQICKQGKVCSFNWRFIPSKTNPYPTRLYADEFYDALETKLNDVNLFCHRHAQKLNLKHVSGDDSSLVELRGKLLNIFLDKDVQSLMKLKAFKRAIFIHNNEMFQKSGDFFGKDAWMSASLPMEEECFTRGFIFHLHPVGIHQDLKIKKEDRQKFENPNSPDSLISAMARELEELSKAEKFIAENNLNAFIQNSIEFRPEAVLRYVVFRPLEETSRMASPGEYGKILNKLVTRIYKKEVFDQKASSAMITVALTYAGASAFGLMSRLIHAGKVWRYLVNGVDGLLFTGSTMSTAARLKKIEQDQKIREQTSFSVATEKASEDDVLALNEKHSLVTLFFIDSALTVPRALLWAVPKSATVIKKNIQSVKDFFDDAHKEAKQQHLATMVDWSRSRPRFKTIEEEMEVVDPKTGAKIKTKVEKRVENSDPMDEAKNRQFIAGSRQISQAQREAYLLEWSKGGGDETLSKLKKQAEQADAPKKGLPKGVQTLPNRSIQTVDELETQTELQTVTSASRLSRAHFYAKQMWLKIFQMNLIRFQFLFFRSSPESVNKVFSKLEKARLKGLIEKSDGQAFVNDFNAILKRDSVFSDFSRWWVVTVRRHTKKDSIFRSMSKWVRAPSSKKKDVFSMVDENSPSGFRFVLNKVERSMQNIETFLSFIPDHLVLRDGKKLKEGFREFFASRRIEDHEIDLLFSHLDMDKFVHRLLKPNEFITKAEFAEHAKSWGVKPHEISITSEEIFRIVKNMVSHNRRKFLNSFVFDGSNPLSKNNIKLYDSKADIFNSRLRNLRDQFSINGLVKRTEKLFEASDELLDLYTGFAMWRKSLEVSIETMLRNLDTSNLMYQASKNGKNTTKEFQKIIQKKIAEVIDHHPLFDVDEFFKENGRLLRSDAVNHIAFQRKILNKQLEEYVNGIVKVSDHQVAWKNAVLKADRYREIRETCLVPGAGMQLAKGNFAKLTDFISVVSVLGSYYHQKKFENTDVTTTALNLAYDLISVLFFAKVATANFGNKYKSVLSVWLADNAKPFIPLAALGYGFNKLLMKEGLLHETRNLKENIQNENINSDLDETLKKIKEYLSERPEYQAELPQHFKALDDLTLEIKKGMNDVNTEQARDLFFRKLFSDGFENDQGIASSQMNVEMSEFSDQEHILKQKNSDLKAARHDLLDAYYKATIYYPVLNKPENEKYKDIWYRPDNVLHDMYQLLGLNILSERSNVVDLNWYYRMIQVPVLDSTLRGFLLSSIIIRQICAKPTTPMEANILAGSTMFVVRGASIYTGLAWRDNLIGF